MFLEGLPTYFPDAILTASTGNSPQVGFVCPMCRRGEYCAAAKVCADCGEKLPDGSRANICGACLAEARLSEIIKDAGIFDC